MHVYYCVQLSLVEVETKLLLLAWPRSVVDVVLLLFSSTSLQSLRLFIISIRSECGKMLANMTLKRLL